MLVFITSVRHPRNSGDYARVESLLRSTLASVCAQTDRNFRVVVVCNRRPAGSFPPEVEFVVVDFPPPSLEAGPTTGREAVLIDKGTKLAVALVAAQRHHPDYVMKFDADDFVSRRLVEFVAAEGGPGWFVEDGYVLSLATGLLTLTHNFVQRCGTSEVIANELFPLPDELPPLDSSQAELTRTLGSFLVRDLLGSHRHSVEYFQSRSIRLQPLPFAGAVYNIGTGENHSGRTWMDRGRPVSQRVAEEFGIGHLRRPGAWWHWLRQDLRAASGKVRATVASRRWRTADGRDQDARPRNER